MKLSVYIQQIIIIALNAGFPAGSLPAQELKIEKITLSASNHDELSPVKYRNGIVYCTNRRFTSLTGYSNKESGLFKLFFAESNSKSGFKTPVLFSDEITTSFNEGPATFNNEGTIIYFTRNNKIDSRLSDISDTSNKLGIYTAERINNVWQNVQPFAYNDPRYTFATPALTFDGKRLYFAADIPGGYGGMDIYFCSKCGNEWCPPVNAGGVINTPGNESYPFADRNGKIYFSSDGHQGAGGKDIYYTFEQDGRWAEAIPLDSLINSPYHDYGIYVDSTGLNGYFTSDRYSTDDIFKFTSVLPEFSACDTFIAHSWCYTFYDERYIPNDSLILKYKWDFGNGIVKHGSQVNYCFPGPGNYSILLDITDAITGDTIAWHVSYDVILEPPAQLNINSLNVSLTGKEISFNTNGSVLKNGVITDYLWDFGDGFKPGISDATRKFPDAGTYTIRAGMKNAESSECVLKELRILENVQLIKQIETVNGAVISLIASSGLTPDIISSFDRAVLINEMPMNILDDNKGFMEKLASAVMNYPDLHLEVQVYHKDKLKAISDSREISFILKNLFPDQQFYGVQVAEKNQVFIEPKGRQVDCIYEFILVKK